MTGRRKKQSYGFSDGTGLKCPRCHCRHFETESTRKKKGFIRRKKRCRHCGHKITTTETVEE